ncbi:MAG TPA: hypothetical protein VMU50_17920, partial [Polyangia bacterium]|nr:hypothetical protein [Polyangia bacterium]
MSATIRRTGGPVWLFCCLAAISVGAGCTSEQRVGILVDNMPPTLDGDLDDAGIDDGGSDDDAPGDDAPPIDDDGGSPDPGGGGAAGGPVAHFRRIAAGQPLPAEATCAARVRRGAPEAIPENASFNQVRPTADELSKLAVWNQARGFNNRAAALGKRVTGNFTGTTDEI